MRPITVTVTAEGSSSIVPLDHYQSPFNVGFGVKVSGTVDYTIQHTFDDIFNSTVTPVWFNHETAVAQSAALDGNYAFPVRGIKVLNNSGTATDGGTTITVIQAGMPGK